MIELGFRIEHRGKASWKIRDNGLEGPCVGDEALLWDALQAVLEENRQLAKEEKPTGKVKR